MCVFFVLPAPRLQEPAVDFSWSRRLRRDCQFSYAIYLENTRWHLCLGLHLSVIYCRSYTSDLYSRWWAAQVLPLFFSLVCLTTDYWIWHLASYADQTEAQTGSTVSPPEKWNSFSGRVNLFKKSFYCDLKANIKLPAGKRDKCAIRSVTSGANVCAQPCYISYCLENQMNQVLLYTGRTESMKLIYTVCFPAGANAVAETVLG